MTLQNYTYDNSIAATKIDNFQVAVPGPTADMALAITRNFQKLYDNLFAEIGVAKDFVGETAPYNHLLLNGQEVSQAAYPDLYKVYSDNGANPTKFGVPVNNENFVLPDCRFRVAVGSNSASIGAGDEIRPAAIAGATGGASLHTMAVNELAGHSHNIPITNTVGGTPVTGINVSAVLTNTQTTTVAVSATGNQTPINMMPPYVVFTKIVRFAV